MKDVINLTTMILLRLGSSVTCCYKSRDCFSDGVLLPLGNVRALPAPGPNLCQGLCCVLWWVFLKLYTRFSCHGMFLNYSQYSERKQQSIRNWTSFWNCAVRLGSGSCWISILSKIIFHLAANQKHIYKGNNPHVFKSIKVALSST